MHQHQHHVLIVEDNEANRDVLKRRLERADCRVTALAAGQEMMASVRADRPDLIILDVRLPDTDGFELTRALKADPATRAIPVAILTASAREEDARQARDAGCDEFLTKPFDWPLLWERLRKLLGNGR